MDHVLDARRVVMTDCLSAGLSARGHAVAANASEAVRQFLAAGGNMQGYDYPQDTYQVTNSSAMVILVTYECPQHLLLEHAPILHLL